MSAIAAMRFGTRDIGTSPSPPDDVPGFLRPTGAAVYTDLVPHGATSPRDLPVDQVRDLLLPHPQHLAQDERRVLAERRGGPAEPARRRVEAEGVALVRRRRALRVLEPLEEPPAREHRV